MTWILGAAFTVSLVALLITIKALKNALYANSNLKRLANISRAADNALVLTALAREIANELMQRDSEKYKERFELLYNQWKIIKASDEKSKLDHSGKITAKYRTFLDFDELGTKSHVLYADGFSSQSYDDLWGLYENIRLYDALNCEIDEEWKWYSTGIDEKEFKHLLKYCKKLSDTKLLAHLHKAREQLDYFESNDEVKKREGEWQYETKDYNYKRIAHFAESRWGVYVKSMDRYGMWGLFVDEKAYTTFYAADKEFKEESLDYLHIRLSIDEREHRRTEKMDW